MADVPSNSEHRHTPSDPPVRPPGDAGWDGTDGHEVLGVVLQIRGGALAVLLWQRARDPESGRWALPGGALLRDEDLSASIQRQLADKVDVRQLSHLEQLVTLGAPDRYPDRRIVVTAYVGLVPAHVDPSAPSDTAWHPTASLPVTAFDHASIIAAGVRRLRSKLSYTNLGFALAPESFTMSELTGYYRAALGHEVSPTNLQRILLRRGQIEPTGESAPSGRSGGRPAAVFRFRQPELEITDPSPCCTRRPRSAGPSRDAAVEVAAPAAGRPAHRPGRLPGPHVRRGPA